MNSVTLRSFAKLNLGLEVVRRRADGYHDINSVFVAIDLADTVTLEPLDELDARCEPPVTERMEDDLVYKAASALREITQARKGAKIRVHKHIPQGGGLGGGSSNAAAVLRGLCALWDLTVAPSQLHEIAASVGSDVPFFLGASPALVKGRGEHVVPIDVPMPWHVCVVTPGIHIATPWAYKQLQRTEERAATDLVATLRRGVQDPDALRAGLVNDFEPVVLDAHPLLATIKHDLYAAGAAWAGMSGSGSTMFGLFTAREAAAAACAEIRPTRTFLCRTLRYEDPAIGG
jgi:4-diphosphocytidyl-2-C-methyl-D-erythritol kinase